MKIKNFLLTILTLIVTTTIGYSQGSCASPFNIGTPTSTVSCYSLSTAGTGGSPCTRPGYGGNNGGYYYFQFCTNANNDCITFTMTDGTTSGNSAISIYNAGSCTFTGNVECIGDQGASQITTSATWGLSANTCYVGRLWVRNPGTFTLCAETTPYPNDNCATAQPISTVPQSGDNICATPGPTTNSPTIVPGDLCAGSLENTAWYSFTTLATGDVVVTIENISCVGGGSGFQIGYFVGSCGTLTNIGCQFGSGGTVTATITGLTAGEQVYIAIDGNAGANCAYDISATNTVPLPIELVYFKGEKRDRYNNLEWMSASEINNSHYTIEKSTDGYNWELLTIIGGAGNSSQELNYEYRDLDIEKTINYYKLSQTDYDGKSETVKIIAIDNIDDRKIELIKTINLMGQEVDENYKGIVIEYYSNGDILKTIK